MRDRGLHRPPAGSRGGGSRAEPARIPRLRLGRGGDTGRQRAGLGQAGGQAEQPEVRAGAGAADGRSVLHDKIVSNIQEIRARGARAIVIAGPSDDKVAPFADTLIEVPPTATLLQPLVATVPLQVFACELAAAKGHDVDQPRNLAKSVTVE